MTGKIQAELIDVLAVLRRLVSHCVAVTGSKQVGTSIVHHAVKRYSRDKVMSDPSCLDAILRDITEIARMSTVHHLDEPAQGFGASYRNLSFDARACLSLKNLFDFDLRRIAAILEMSDDEVTDLYDLSLVALTSELTKARRMPSLH